MEMKILKTMEGITLRQKEVDCRSITKIWCPRRCEIDKKTAQVSKRPYRENGRKTTNKIDKIHKK